MGVVDQTSKSFNICVVFFGAGLKKSCGIMEFGGVDVEFFACGWGQAFVHEVLNDVMHVLR